MLKQSFPGFNLLIDIKKKGTSAAIQWLTPPFNTGGVNSIPGERTKVPHAAGYGQKFKNN